MMTIPQIVKDMRGAMDKGIESTRREFTSIRSGKATPNMLDTVHVDMYGTSMARPFDKSQAKAIEKAIRESDLGLDPSAQGPIIRVPLPSMNEQRRKELVKVVHKLAEEGKIAVRHARTHAREGLKKLQGVSEDDVKHAEKDLQRIHDDYIHKIDDLIKAKEAEIMEV